MFRALLTFILVMSWSSTSNALPKCKGSPLKRSYYDHSSKYYGSPSLEKSWTNCIGKITRPDYNKIYTFEGTYKDGIPNGFGFYRESNTLEKFNCTRKVGLFNNGVLVEGKWKECNRVGGAESTIDGIWKKKLLGRKATMSFGRTKDTIFRYKL